jgi:dihydropteroate synthase
VSKSIVERVHEAKKAGIFSWNVIVDPGIGFAKGGEQNLTLTKRLSTIKNRCYQLPILVCIFISS